MILELWDSTSCQQQEGSLSKRDFKPSPHSNTLCPTRPHLLTQHFLCRPFYFLSNHHRKPSYFLFSGTFALWLIIREHSSPSLTRYRYSGIELPSDWSCEILFDIISLQLLNNITWYAKRVRENVEKHIGKRDYLKLLIILVINNPVEKIYQNSLHLIENVNKIYEIYQ